MAHVRDLESKPRLLASHAILHKGTAELLKLSIFVGLVYGEIWGVLIVLLGNACMLIASIAAMMVTTYAAAAAAAAAAANSHTVGTRNAA